MSTDRVLSIQSHVVYGYVGNKCATFPLQVLGFDVDPLNSVQLSNHTAYKAVKGQRLAGEDLETVLEGLRANGLMCYSHVLTGYNSSATFLRTIAKVVREVRDLNPDAQYVCDPVLGDHGRLYVPADLIPIYRDEIVPLATLLTPNQFEAEQLSGVSITDVPSAFAAIDALHAMGARSVVITSSALPAGQDTHMLLIASTPWDNVRNERPDLFAGVDRSASPYARFAVTIPKLASVFTGSGDLTTALLLAHSTRLQGAFASAVERTIAAVQGVCRRTMDHYAGMVAQLERARAIAATAPASPDSADRTDGGPIAGAGASSGPGADCTQQGQDQSGAGSTGAVLPQGLRPMPLLLQIAASTSGQMGATIPGFNELRLVQSLDLLTSVAVPDHLRAFVLAA